MACQDFLLQGSHGRSLVETFFFAWSPAEVCVHKISVNAVFRIDMLLTDLNRFLRDVEPRQRALPSTGPNYNIDFLIVTSQICQKATKLKHFKMMSSR